MYLENYVFTKDFSWTLPLTDKNIIKNKYGKLLNSFFFVSEEISYLQLIHRNAVENLVNKDFAL